MSHFVSLKDIIEDYANSIIPRDELKKEAACLVTQYDEMKKKESDMSSTKNFEDEEGWTIVR